MSSAGSQPLIPEFYAGRSVFITGATGFMGKVLIERLLSTCLDIGRLFLLIRTKRDVAPETRLQLLKHSRVFDVLRATNPSQLEKLVLIPGDTTEPQLGISLEYMGLLHEVSVVFHSAATVKFDEELKKAVEQNVRSVMRVMDICDRLPHIEVGNLCYALQALDLLELNAGLATYDLVCKPSCRYVSTAYSNCERSYIEERIYPAPAPLDPLLALVDSAPPQMLNEFTAKYIDPKPNTYTFTKAVAENVIEQHRRRHYSIAIFRPSIVISSVSKPFPGWIENLNGPSGVIVAAGKGILHAFNVKSSARADMIPVDIAIDTLIAISWETATDKSQDIRVYNCCSTNDNPTTWGEFKHGLFKNLKIVPFNNNIWYPCTVTTENEYLHKAFGMLTQTIPLYAAEYVSRLLGIKKQISFITADQKIQAMCKVLKFFSLQEFRFDTNNVRRLRARLSPADANIYNLDVGTINWEEHYRDFVMGSKKYILNEKDQDMTAAKRQQRRMWYLHMSLSFLSLLVFLRLLLRNQFIKSFMFGVIRLMTSLVYTAYSSAVKKL